MADRKVSDEDSYWALLEKDFRQACLRLFLRTTEVALRWLNDCWEDRHFSRWLLITEAVTVCIGILGAVFATHPFWGSFLINLAVAGIGVVLTVLFVQRLLDYKQARDKAQEWGFIRKHKVLALLSSVENTAVSITMYLEPKDASTEWTIGWFALLASSEDDQGKAHLLGKLREKYADVSQLDPAEIAARKVAALLRSLKPGDIDKDILDGWIDSSSADFSRLREVIIPRLLQCSPDMELTNLAIEYESSTTGLRQTADLFDTFGVMFITRNLAYLLDMTALVVHYIKTNYPDIRRVPRQVLELETATEDRARQP
jgi:hypothetical protein